MQKWKLKNGITLIYEHKNADSAAINVLVKTGSDYEKPHLRGISHFIEHMVFEGTPKRPTARDVTNEIERIGGDINAYTTNARTCFHVKVIRKHFDTALDVLADVLQRPLLTEKDTEKQKNILFKEIDLVTDEPRFHQWIMFEQALFKKHPIRYPTYGTRKTVGKTTAKDLWEYFNKYYTMDNMIISVVGNISKVKQKIEAAFNGRKGKIIHQVFSEPMLTKVRVKKEKRKIENNYLVLGHRTAPRWHNDSYIFDVIEAIIGRGQSGWMFNEIRNKRGLAYEVGVEHTSEKDFGFLATYLSVNKKHLDEAKMLVLEQLRKLNDVSNEEVEEAKTYVEGSFVLDHEDTEKLADEIVFMEQMGDALWMKDYISRIKEVTVEDIQRVVKKYLEKPYAMAVIEGKN